MTLEGDKLLGHQVPETLCGCGKTGCFETYLSGPGFERIFTAFYGEKLSAVDIIARYYDGDHNAKLHVERYMSLLAHYLGNVLSVFDPDLLVIGGGLSQFEEIYRLLPEYLPQYLYGVASLPAIHKARYGRFRRRLGRSLSQFFRLINLYLPPAVRAVNNKKNIG